MLDSELISQSWWLALYSVLCIRIFYCVKMITGLHTVPLQVTPSPWKPWLQVQEKLPSTLWQVASVWQLATFVEQMSTPAKWKLRVEDIKVKQFYSMITSTDLSRITPYTGSRIYMEMSCTHCLTIFERNSRCVFHRFANWNFLSNATMKRHLARRRATSRSPRFSRR